MITTNCHSFTFLVQQNNISNCKHLSLFQVENRALRLRESGEMTAALLVDPQLSSSPLQLSSTSPQNDLSGDNLNVRLGSLKRHRNLNNYNTNSDLIGGTHSLTSSSASSGRVSWDYFDERGYISRGGLREGEDPYVRNRFNQQASDSLPSNRDIPDTRNPT